MIIHRSRKRYERSKHPMIEDNGTEKNLRENMEFENESKKLEKVMVRRRRENLLTLCHFSQKFKGRK